MRVACLALLIFPALTLVGCAKSSSIQDASSTESQFDKAAIYDGERQQVQPALPGVETHRIFHQGSTGFTSVESVRRSAMARVVEFCKLKGDEPYIVEETTSKPPHVLGNWPRIEIVFSCVARKSSVPGSQTDRYDELRKLKELFDEGVISREDYEREKEKMFSQ